MGQLAFATPELLAAEGIAEERRRPEALLASPPKTLLTTVDEMAGAPREEGRGPAGSLNLNH